MAFPDSRIGAADAAIVVGRVGRAFLPAPLAGGLGVRRT